MRRFSAGSSAIGLALCAVLVPGGTAHADTVATTTLVSVSLDGTPSHGSSGAPSVSADGRYVAFTSSADDLVAGDTNRASDVFLRDLQAGVTTRVSVSSAGVQADASSGTPSVSADGRYIAFVSTATNLVPGDTNKAQDVFVRDRATGVTNRITAGWRGEANSDSYHPAISADGRFVAYDSFASNLVSNDTNGVHDVFSYNRESDYTVRVSVDSNNFQGNGVSQRPSISADGRYVAFESDASNIALFPDTNHATDVFVNDRLGFGLGGRTDRVSLNANTTEGNSASRFSMISADGRYIAYQSYASNLVPGDTNDNCDNFLFDWRRSTVTRLNLLPTGEQAPQGTTQAVRPSISGDGRYVAFESGESDLVPHDYNSVWDVFVRDRTTATTALASVTGDGVQANSDSTTPAISSDGKHVAFQSFATNLAAGTPDWSPQVFMRDLG